jgi:predicted RNA-binding Zn-ribbon protein involved in translation (DUF1610 family)
MAEVLALDWRCSQCGDAMTWQLVKAAPGQEQIEVIELMREPPTLDWSCARCGEVTTWMLHKS